MNNSPLVFTPVTLNRDQVPKRLITLIDERVNPLLHDVHWMLRHPRPGTSEPAFNLSIAQVLCSIVGGLARIFCNETVNDKDAYLQVLEYYPSEDANGTLAGRDFALELYKVYRCNLVHALGMNMDRPNNGSRWTIFTFDETKKITRHPIPLSEQQLLELNQDQRPQWLEPTLSRRSGVVRLNADSLYWGVRRLVVTVATDRDRQKVAADVLDPTHPIGKDHSTVSSATYAVTNVFSTITSLRSRPDEDRTEDDG